MFQHVKVLALAFAVLLSAVAPAAAECLVRASAQAGMECCKRDAPCGSAVLQRACCPCSPEELTPAPARTATPPAPSVSLAAGQPEVPFTCPGRISAGTSDAFATTLLRASHDPPWLLNSAFLI